MDNNLVKNQSILDPWISEKYLVTLIYIVSKVKT
jgi:hypothetical protein